MGMYFSSELRITLCIIAAFIFHLAALIAGERLLRHLEQPPKTIPMVILSNQSPSINQTLKQQSASTSDKQVITSTKASSFNAPDSKTEQASKPQTAKVEAQQTHPSNEQQRRQSRANQGLKSLFKTTDQENQAQPQVTQISTREAEQLSTYQLTLIQHLSKAQLYDQFNRYMSQTGKKAISFEVSIKLFASGAISFASLSQSTGNDTLDQLAINAVYNASPYPAPPANDASKGFRYLVPMRYEENNGLNQPATDKE